MQFQAANPIFTVWRTYKKCVRRLQRIHEQSSASKLPVRVNKKRSMLQRRIERLLQLFKRWNPKALLTAAAWSAAVLGGSLFNGPMALAQPTIVSITPTSPANQNANVEVTFSTLMDANTMQVDEDPNVANVNLYSSLRGYISTHANVSYWFIGGKSSFIINPDVNFLAGEVLTLSIDGAETNPGGVPIARPEVFQFRTKTGDGTAVFTSATLSAGTSSASVTIADFDEDGDMDAFFANKGGAANTIWKNDGRGNFTESTRGNGDSRAAAAGDLDGDGDMDVIVVNYDTEAQFYRNYNGNFSFPTIAGITKSTDVVLGDLDGDGDLDIYEANTDGEADRILFNNGNATFTTSTFGNFNSESLAIGDVDGDGALDILVGVSGGSNRLLTNDIHNGGLFVESTLPGEPFGATIADFDNDGTPETVFAPVGGNDLLIGDFNTDDYLDQIIIRDDEVEILKLNNGDGTFTSSTFGDANLSSVAGAVADLDADNDLDFLIAMDNGLANQIFTNINLAGPRIVSVSPSTNSSVYADGDDITVLFDREIKSGTFTTGSAAASAKITIWGSQTGFDDSATIVMDANGTMATVTPSRAFMPGEKITATVKNVRAENNNGLMPKSISWQFHRAPYFGSEVFSSGTFGAVAQHEDVTLGDLDGDDDLDVLFTEDQSVITMWINDGDADFTESTFGQNNGSGTAVADLDNDGDLDVVLARFGTKNAIYWNNGDATFVEELIGISNGETSSVAVGDINGDGLIDIIVGGENLDQDELYYNNGDGTFDETPLGSSTRVTNLSVGDLDNDGDMDIIAATRLMDNYRYVNQGDGTFEQRGFGRPDDYSTYAYLADLNGDAVNELYFGRNGSAQGDFDADGNMDQVIVGGEDHDFLYNNGDGTFTTDSKFYFNHLSEGTAVGDMDGDGDLDVVIANRRHTMGNTLLLQGGTPRIKRTIPGNGGSGKRSADLAVVFSERMVDTGFDGLNQTIFLSTSMTGTTAATVELNDFNGRVTVNPDEPFFAGERVMMTVTKGSLGIEGEINATSAVVSFRAGAVSGSATFTTSTVGTNSDGVVAADFDGDGNIDIFLADESGHTLLTGNGDGTFSTNNLGIGTDKYPAAGDIDNDGDLDLIVVGEGADEILLNNGDGTFTRSTLGDGDSRGVAFGDLDSDGDLDAVVAQNDQRQSRWINDGTGSFTLFSDLTDRPATGVVVADFSGDNIMDAVYSVSLNHDTYQIYERGNGDGRLFGGPLPGTTRASDVDFGDLDGDGDLDAILAYDGDGAQNIWDNPGDGGGFTRRFLGGGSSGGVVIGDLDGDNDLDVIVTNSDADDDEIWINNGDGTFVINNFDNPADGDIHLADFDNDGDLDAIALDNDGAPQLWLNIDPTPTIVAYSPATHAMAIAPSTNFTLSFAEEVRTTTLQITDHRKARNLTLLGSQSANFATRATVNYSITGSTITIDPAEDLFPGERVFLTVQGLQSSRNGKLNRSINTEYRVAALNGSGAFYPTEFGNTTSNTASTGDLNNDGNPDVFLGSSESSSTNAEIWWGNGDGSFNLTTTPASPHQSSQMHDINADGLLDVVLVPNTSGTLPAVEILYNQGNGSFMQIGVGGNFGRGVDATVRDFDGDGDLDILSMHSDSTRILLQERDGGFVTSYMTRRAKQTAIVSGDFNRDGGIDVFRLRRNGTSRISINRGDGTFFDIFTREGEGTDVETADLNADGLMDLVILSTSSGDMQDPAADPAALVWLGRSVGGFNSSPVILPRSANDLEMADVDADGDIDVVLSTASGKDLLLVNKGDGTFVVRELENSASNALTSGDFDNDGNIDLIMARSGGNLLMLNLQTPAISTITPTSVIAQTTSLAVTATGTEFYVTGASISTLDPNGTPNGVKHFPVTGASLTSASFEIPAGLVSTVGTVTLNLITGAGSTSTTISILNDQPLISTSNTTLTTTEDNSTTLCFSLFDISPGISGLTVTPPDADGVTIASIVQQGATAATTKFLVTPVADQSGTVDLTFSVSDGNLSSSTTVSLTVQAINDPPTVATNNRAVITDEDTPLTSWVQIGDIDTDLTALSLSVTSSNQAVVTNGGIAVPTTAGAVTPVQFNPIANANGSTDITLFVSDGEFTRSTTFNLTVNPVNDPPTISTGNTVLNLLEDEDGSLWVDLNDIDNTFSELQLTATSNNQSLLADANLTVRTPTSASTQIDFDPSDNANGSALITVTVNDGEFQRTTTFSLNVASVNDVPQISVAAPNYVVDEDASTSVQISVADLDNPLSQVVLTASSDNPSLLPINNINITTPTTASTQIDLTPLANQFGSAVVTISADDGTVPQTTSFTLVVNPVNDAPTITSIGDVTIYENGATTVSFSIADIETSAGNLIVTATSSNQSLFMYGFPEFSATAANMTLLIKGNCNKFGTAAVYVSVFDGITTTQTVFTFTVIDLPVIEVVGDMTPCPGSRTRYSLTPNINVGTHKWSIAGGTIVRGHGTEEIVVEWNSTLINAGYLEVERQFPNSCFSLTHQNLPPLGTIQLVNDFASVSAQTSTTLSVLANDMGTGLTLLTVETPSNGTVAVNNGDVSYTPAAGFSGLEVFNYTAENADGCTATGAIVVAVTAPQMRVNNFYVERLKNRSGTTRGLNSASGVAQTPDGKYLYASGRSDNSIAIFAVNANSGELTYLSRTRDGYSGVDGLKYVMDVTVSPDGRNLYAAGNGENELAVFAIEPNGALTFLEIKKHGADDYGTTIDGLAQPRRVEVSPDGKNVYVASYSSRAICVFERWNADGRLKYIEMQKDGVNGVNGLNYAIDVAISPDGKNVYAAGYGDKAVAMFSRDLNDGALTYLGQMKDGVNGVDGLAGATAVHCSPDGLNVYATGAVDNCVVVFDRTTTGTLVFMAKHKDGQNGVNELDGAGDVKVSPDGRHVWVTAQDDDALTLFQRNADGSLQVLESMVDGVNGVDGLNKPVDLAISPASNYVYSAAYIDDAVAVFYRNIQPVAFSDVSLSTVKNATTNLDVLANDEDEDGHTMTINSKTDGALGTVAITGGGTSLEYAAGSTTGADQFTYTIEDDFGGSSTATVAITVQNPKSALLTVDQGANTQPDSKLTHDLQIAPNPVNTEMRISLSLAEERSLVLTIVDATGRSLTEIHRGPIAGGQSEINWTLSSEFKQYLPSGQYMLMLESIDGAAPIQVAEPFLIVH